jgi:hypothetical protein
MVPRVFRLVNLRGVQFHLDDFVLVRLSLVHACPFAVAAFFGMPLFTSMLDMLL